jgi:hypothetical protein
MVEYMEKRFGWDAIRKLLFSYADGIREDEAMRGAFGISREEFHREFLVWAASEVHAWGLSPEPSMRTLALELASADEAQRAAVAAAETARLTKVATAWSEAIGRPGSKRFNLKSGDWPSAPMPAVTFDDATIARLREAYPDQPDLVEIALDGTVPPGQRAPSTEWRLHRDLLVARGALEEAGAFSVVIECVPQDLAATITKELSIPTIGIGASSDCDGQVLVSYDLLGLQTGEHRPKFLKQFAQLGKAAVDALVTYGDEVRSRTFPSPTECYQDSPPRPSLTAMPGHNAVNEGTGTSDGKAVA